jgi:cell division protein FtsL
VEKVARERLAMRNATPAVTQYVPYSPAAASASGSAK